MSNPGGSIGRFALTEELGRGSMGIVHRAHDPVMGRDVAIKTVLLPHGLLPEKKREFHERFLREAQAAGRLSHPSIVTVYDFDDGASGGSPFIAMEYVEGRTLHELICAESSLNPSWVLSVGETLADALRVAHEAGVVHRDLKPANILVREADGVAKISDFGVARVNQSELTGAGSTYGSPAYMAPERLRGAPADARSDLFALAVILYEVLCGERPFGGDDFASTCTAILLESPASIHQRDPTLAPAFDRFFARALAKNPDDRFQTGAAFRDALQALRDEQQWFQSGEATGVIRVPTVQETPAPEAVAQGSPRSRRSLALAACAMLLLVLALVWGGLRPSPDPAPADPPPAAVPTAATPAPPRRSPGPPVTVRKPPVAPRPEPKAAPAQKAEPSGPNPVHLDLRIKNRLKAGTLTLFVDGKQAYATTLAAESRKNREEISAGVDLPPGPHTLTARVVQPGEARNFEQSLKLKVEPGSTPGLTVVVGRKVLGPPLTLTLE